MIQITIEVTKVHLEFTSWVIVVGWFERHSLEHSMKTHVNFRVTLNQVLEFANDGRERFRCVSMRFGVYELFVKPDVVIPRQLRADSMMNNKRHHKLAGVTQHIRTTFTKKMSRDSPKKIV